MRAFRVALLVLFAAGCGELKSPTAPAGSGEPIDSSATFTRVQNEIFTPSCATFVCHDTLGQQQGLVLAAGRAYASIVSKPSTQVASLQLVTAGNADNSYLYRKVTGVGITGDRMPQGRAPLSPEQLKLLRDWIRRGAPND